MYKTHNDDFIIRVGDGAFIPKDTYNVDYQEYLSWVAEGNAPVTTPVQPAAIPDAVTMRQARLALLHAGKLAAVDSAIANMSGSAGDAARIEWEFSNTVERNKSLVRALGPAIGMTDQDLDSLFLLAATL